jgi:hypothetical protein
MPPYLLIRCACIGVNACNLHFDQITAHINGYVVLYMQAINIVGCKPGFDPPPRIGKTGNLLSKFYCEIPALIGAICCFYGIIGVLILKIDLLCTVFIPLLGVRCYIVIALCTVLILHLCKLPICCKFFVDCVIHIICF